MMIEFRISTQKLFSFSSLKIPSYCILAATITVKDSPVSFIVSSLKFVCLLFIAVAFNMSSSLIFSSL